MQPPQQQQHHYLINNHIIQQSDNFWIQPPYDDPPADNNYCYITMANNLQRWSSSTWSTEASEEPAASIAPSVFEQHRRTTEPQRSIFSTTNRPPMQMICYLIPPSLMQHIIINNIKQAPPLDVRRQEIIYYGWRAREWGRNDGRDYINTMNINI